GIDPATGSAALAASRRFPEFGIVREVTNDGRSSAMQLGAGLSMFWGKIPVLGSTRSSVGYTWTQASATAGQLAAPGYAGATAGGQPTAFLERGAAPHTPDHMLIFSASARRSSRMTLSVLGRLSSGLPFTPMVFGDANGDGLTNDRAYVFAPDARDLNEDARGGLGKLLMEAPANVRECLRSNIGRIAAYNACRTQWAASVDVNARFQFGPTLGNPANRRVTLWVAASNIAAGLDYALHGADRLRGWGQTLRVDDRLLSISGFDPDTRSFRYDVNPRFGTAVSHGTRRLPFAISLQVRVVIGSDHQLAAFEAARRAGTNRDAALQPPALREHFRLQFPNVPAEVLALNGPVRLNLTPTQVGRLGAAADSLALALNSVTEVLVSRVSGSGAVPPKPLDFAELLRLGARGVEIRDAGREVTRVVLTREQWAKLPRSVRESRPGFSPFPPETFESDGDF
ncbi:MAG TPA: hypothetical protein VE913_21755, partial [Longimicrobium sp.]|nr:hypothetical protein [Longimicrobium sp.]